MSARTKAEKELDALVADQAPYSAALRILLYPPVDDDSVEGRLKRAIADLLIERL